MNLINNLLGVYCFGSFRMRMGGKITFKLGHPVFEGGIEWCIFPQCFCQNGLNFFWRLALQEKKLMTARVSLKSCASTDTLPFNLCNKKRLAIQLMNRPLSNDTVVSVLRHREVGLRTYQHTLTTLYSLLLYYTHATCHIFIIFLPMIMLI